MSTNNNPGFKSDQLYKAAPPSIGETKQWDFPHGVNFVEERLERLEKGQKDLASQLNDIMKLLKRSLGELDDDEIVAKESELVPTEGASSSIKLGIAPAQVKQPAKVNQPKIKPTQIQTSNRNSAHADKNADKPVNTRDPKKNDLKKEVSNSFILEKLVKLQPQSDAKNGVAVWKYFVLASIEYLEYYSHSQQQRDAWWMVIKLMLPRHLTKSHQEGLETDDDIKSLMAYLDRRIEYEDELERLAYRIRFNRLNDKTYVNKIKDRIDELLATVQTDGWEYVKRQLQDMFPMNLKLGKHRVKMSVNVVLLDYNPRVPTQSIDIIQESLYDIIDDLRYIKVRKHDN